MSDPTGAGRLNRLDGLVAFRHVAMARSFSGAAVRLDVSPQAVSQSIRQLEQRLGVRLFHRTTRSVSLTEAGEGFLQRVAPALEDLLAATETLEASQSGPRGILRIGLAKPAFAGVLLPRLGEFHQRYPDIHLDFRFDDSLVDIVALGLDAGIRLGEFVARDMVSIPLTRRERLVLVASPAYLVHHGVPTALADLAGHRAIRFRSPTHGNLYRWELVDRGKPLEMAVEGPVTVNDPAAMLLAAEAGLGIALVLESAAREALGTGRLKEVLAGAGGEFPGYHLYFSSRRQLSPKLRGFLDFWKA